MTGASRMRSWFIVACLIASAVRAASEQPAIRVGSKAFTESLILGEMITQLARDAGAAAVHKRALAGTRIAFAALESGELDVYPEYTGTITEEILAGQDIRDLPSLRRTLADREIVMSAPLGFNNTYVLGMRDDLAAQRHIRSISDLRRHPELRFGFSNEFMNRSDGWPSLQSRYHLPQKKVRGLQHDLAYRGIADGDLDLIDLYSTDAEIDYYNLRRLEDDLGHFPAYHAVILFRADLIERRPDVVAAIRRLEGALNEQHMVALNARAKLEKVSARQVAADFLEVRFGIAATQITTGPVARLARHTWEHLFLVGVSLSMAIAVAVPLGIIAAQTERRGQLVLGLTGIVQTIPSLALLVFMIPIFGLGAAPAVAALFLYSLLPIVRNTCTGLRDIPASLLEAADALGLPRRARLLRVELPLAASAILAGIKTSAVINVGTATLGGFIAAGGYGQLIFDGLTLDNMSLVFQGAIPAAVMALGVQGLFDIADRIVVPRGLRLPPAATADA